MSVRESTMANVYKPHIYRMRVESLSTLAFRLYVLSLLCMVVCVSGFLHVVASDACAQVSSGNRSTLSHMVIHSG